MIGGVLLLLAAPTRSLLIDGYPNTILHQTGEFGPRTYDVRGEIVFPSPVDLCSPPTLPPSRSPTSSPTTPSSSSSSSAPTSSPTPRNATVYNNNNINNNNNNNSNNGDNNITKQIYLALRGGCTFLEKAYNARALGASGLIVGNDQNSADVYVRMAGNGWKNITFPSIFIRWKDYNIIRSMRKIKGIHTDTLSLTNNDLDGESSGSSSGGSSGSRSSHSKMYIDFDGGVSMSVGEEDDNNNIQSSGEEGGEGGGGGEGSGIFATLNSAGEIDLDPGEMTPLRVAALMLLALPVMWCTVAFAYCIRKNCVERCLEQRRRNRASRLPIVNYQDPTESLLTPADPRYIHNDSCAICLEDFTVGERVKRLPCGHGFHPGCVDPWLTRSDLCPTCKASVSNVRPAVVANAGGGDRIGVANEQEVSLPTQEEEQRQGLLGNNEVSYSSGGGVARSSVSGVSGIRRDDRDSGEEFEPRDRERKRSTHLVTVASDDPIGEEEK